MSDTSGTPPAAGVDGSTYTKVPDASPPPATTTPPPSPQADAQPAPPATGDKAAAPGTLVGGDKPAAADATKPGEEAKPDEKKPDEPAALKAEDYKIEFPAEITEGAKDPLVAAFLPLAAKHGLTNEIVQALINDMGPVLRSDATAAWDGLQAQWQAEFKADPAIGGPKLGETIARLNTAITRFADNEAHAKAISVAMQITGAGNNLPLMKLINNMASRLAEGTPVSGNGAAPQGRDPGSLLYTHPTSQPGATATRA